MAKSRRRESRKNAPEPEMVVFAAAGEPRAERKMRCNQSRLRFRTSLRRMSPAPTER